VKKSKRSKACDITQKVKNAVWERDRHKCVLCGTNQAMPNAHYIPRSQGGLGVEQNIVTLCLDCHRRLDQTTERQTLLEYVKSYLDIFYPGFSDDDRKYRRF
jgi:5-methylcytosine-specific restriction endonuclease McrA